jgi:putative phosphoesterase
MYPPDVGDQQRGYKLYPDVTVFEVHAPSLGLEVEKNLSSLDLHMRPQRLGLISDTHGLLRPQAVEALRGCAHIIHAGDVGKRGDQANILDELARIAPVTAVRGNNDHGVWAEALPDIARLEFGGIHIHVLHILEELAFDPAAEGVKVVVSGHSHQPKLETRDGVLYVNPGSAGPCRFRLPVCVGRLWVVDGEPRAELIELSV